MRTIARPSGPLPARVYWFRRLLVLGVFLGLVFGLAQVFGDRGSEPEADKARTVGAESGSQPPSPAPSSTAGAMPLVDEPQATRGSGNRAEGDKKQARDGKKKRRAEKSPTKTPLPEPTGPCDNSEIVVTPKVRGKAYAGKRVRFRLDLTTTSTPACTWQVSPRSLVVKLTSGEDRIWSSQDCPDAIPEKGVVVRREHPAKVYIGWRGQRSDSTCSRTTDWAQAGWYHINAAAFGAEPADLQFELKPPVPATITPSPKPEKDKKRD
jgi:hypothetical protein